ncbi:MAG: hypothetical protein GX660_15380 [Clostridiaceae bacterium]|nr:hypothetical protein [Clostridiaceae bacterium]
MAFTDLDKNYVNRMNLLSFKTKLGNDIKEIVDKLDEHTQLLATLDPSTPSTPSEPGSNFAGTPNDETFDNHPIIQALVDNLQEGGKIVIPEGEWYCFNSINMLSVPKGITFICYGTLKFSNDTDGIILGSEEHFIFINKIEGRGYATTPTYSEYRGVALKLQNVRFSEIHVNNILGLETGFNLHGEGNGTYYNHIFLGGIRQCETGILLSAGDIEGSFVNSNRIYGGFMYCYNGVIFSPGSDPFNNNTFFGTGFENMANKVLVLAKANGNSFLYPRFEDGVGLSDCPDWIEEDTSTCSCNRFHLDLPIYISKLTKQKGKRTRIYGTFMNDSGSRIGYERFIDDSGNIHYLHDSTPASDSQPNTVFLRTDNHYQTYLYGIRLLEGETLKNFDVGEIAPYGFVEVANTNHECAKNTNTIRVTNDSAAVTIQMNAHKEVHGKSVYIIVNNYTPANAITVNKSDGSLISTIDGEGIYMFHYHNYAWRMYRIGTVSRLVGRYDLDVPSLEPGATHAEDVTLTGVRHGQHALQWTTTNDRQDVMIHCYVKASDTVRVVCHNLGSAAKDLNSMTLKVVAERI